MAGMNGEYADLHSRAGFYTGQLSDGEHHGVGTYTSPKGYAFVGHWAEGMAHGCGMLTQDGKELCRGEWVKDQCHGHGQETLEDGPTAATRG